MTHLFVSHSSRDQRAADLVRASLVSAGFVAPAEGDRVRRVFGGEDVFGARRSGWWVASG